MRKSSIFVFPLGGYFVILVYLTWLSYIFPLVTLLVWITLYWSLYCPYYYIIIHLLPGGLFLSFFMIPWSFILFCRSFTCITCHKRCWPWYLWIIYFLPFLNNLCCWVHLVMVHVFVSLLICGIISEVYLLCLMLWLISSVGCYFSCLPLSFDIHFIPCLMYVYWYWCHPCWVLLLWYFWGLEVDCNVLLYSISVYSW